MASLHEEAKESQKNIEDVEKVIDDPGLCKKIRNSVYMANSTAISIEEDDGIVVHTYCDRDAILWLTQTKQIYHPL